MKLPSGMRTFSPPRKSWYFVVSVPPLFGSFDCAPMPYLKRPKRPMFDANPSVANAAGYASSQPEISGPGDKVYGASAPMSSVQLRLRNSALPPTPMRSANRPPGVSSPSAGAAFAAFGGAFFAGAASSSGGGAGGFEASFSSSSAGALLLQRLLSPFLLFF